MVSLFKLLNTAVILALILFFFPAAQSLLNGGITSWSLSTTPNTMMMTGWLVGFHQFRNILWKQSKPRVIMWVHHLILAKIFLIWIKMLLVVRMLEFVQKLFSAIFPLVFMACDKNFLILYEYYWISACTTCLIRNSFTPMSLAMDLIETLEHCRS